MSLSAQFKEAAAQASTPFETWIASLNDADRAALTEYATNPNISHHKFVHIIKSAGARVGRDTVTAWRVAQGYVSQR